jgi:small subunit ribosomal protein S10
MNNLKPKQIRIKLESFDHKILNISCQKIIEKIQSTEAKIVGPIPLPTKKRIYCVLRSPHVNKDAREHFEIRIHRRILDIYPTTNNTANLLLSINLPSGVTSTIK